MKRPSGIVPLLDKKLEAEPGLAPTPVAPVAPMLKNNGGSVLGAVEVVPIYWGAFWTDTQGTGPQLADQLDGFFDFIVTSPFMDMLSEYSTSDTEIGYGTRLPSVKISASEPGTMTMSGRQVLDSEIQTALEGWIKDNTVPATTSNTLYFVYLPPNVLLIKGGSQSCTGFCGYHEHIDKKIFYAAMPYVTCMGCTADAQSVFDTLTKVSSHELA